MLAIHKKRAPMATPDWRMLHGPLGYVIEYLPHARRGFLRFLRVLHFKRTRV